MCPMFVTECFHNKCFKLSTLHSVYISPGCELDMILSVMTIPILDDEEEKNLPDPRLELIDRQFNLKMKELFGQTFSEHLVPYNVEATLHHTASDMLKYLAKYHPLTWVTQVKISSEEDELSIWMSTMKNNIDVLVTQFQQQMYTGFSKMLVEMGKLYHK